MSVTDSLARLEELQAKRKELLDEQRPIFEKLKSDTPPDAGQVQRAGNLNRAIDKLDVEIKAAEKAWSNEMFEGVKAGHYGMESGDANPRNDSPGSGGDSPGRPDGMAAAMLDAGWNLKTHPSVAVSGHAMLKASTFPAMTTWNPTTASAPAQLGRDQRFLWPNLPMENARNSTAVSDFVQSVRTLTGTVERAIDAVTTKATVDATIVASVEAIKQFAVTLDSVPNAVLESVPQISAFLDGEGRFQVNKAIDTHVLAQIVAATPAFGNTGTTTIDKVRNAIASMRALGADPNVLVLNPTDAAALDLFRVGGSTATDGPYAYDFTRGPSHPLWGLKVIERIGGGSDPMYLLDTKMLGVLYVGQIHFDADPFTEFKKNLTTLRVEVNALFHVRNIQGARRIAAA